MILYVGRTIYILSTLVKGSELLQNYNLPGFAKFLAAILLIRDLHEGKQIIKKCFNSDPCMWWECYKGVLTGNHGTMKT